jgi:hypothetical protein
MASNAGFTRHHAAARGRKVTRAHPLRRTPQNACNRISVMRKKRRTAHSSYAIGYGRPPTSSQFQPGQSGNPKGRPTGARNASSMARTALERMVSIQVKGTWRKMTVRKAAYLRLAERAVAGDAKAFDYLLSLESEEHPPGSDQPESERSAVKDLAMLQDFFDRQRADRPQLKRHDHPQRGAGANKRGNK